jgi:hypothetical protein
MSNVTFYIEEVHDGDPPSESPLDGGNDENFEDASDIVDLMDLTGQMVHFRVLECL